MIDKIFTVQMMPTRTDQVLTTLGSQAVREKIDKTLVYMQRNELVYKLNKQGIKTSEYIRCPSFTVHNFKPQHETLITLLLNAGYYVEEEHEQNI
jgi:hypothetical protein